MLRQVVHDVFGPEFKIQEHRGRKSLLTEKQKEDIRNFFCRNNVSRQTPGVKDVKIINGSNSGKRVKLQKNTWS